MRRLWFFFHSLLPRLKVAMGSAVHCVKKRWLICWPGERLPLWFHCDNISRSCNLYCYQSRLDVRPPKQYLLIRDCSKRLHNFTEPVINQCIGAGFLSCGAEITHQLYLTLKFIIHAWVSFNFIKSFTTVSPFNDVGVKISPSVRWHYIYKFSRSGVGALRSTRRWRSW